MLRFLTAGESHGEGLIGILEGMPCGLKIDIDFIDRELKRRQEGYGRGERMKIEKDRARILSGVLHGVTIGSPICIIVMNRDFSIENLPELKNVRPGHADLAGALKYGFKDARPVLERASARETAIRVAIGAICKLFLLEFNIKVLSRVLMVGGVSGEKEIKKKIDAAIKAKDTLGGVFEVIVKGVPPGLGSYVHFDRRLDANLAGIVMSIPGIKAVEIGNAIEASKKFGSEVHDEIFYSNKRSFYRVTNNAGGIEGGVSNGEDIVVRGYMKPISTLMKGLRTVDIVTKKPVRAATERSDVCAVDSVAVIGEAVCGFVISNAILEKFGGDNLLEIKKAYRAYLDTVKS